MPRPRVAACGNATQCHGIPRKRRRREMTMCLSNASGNGRGVWVWVKFVPRAAWECAERSTAPNATQPTPRLGGSSASREGIPPHCHAGSPGDQGEGRPGGTNAWFCVNSPKLLEIRFEGFKISNPAQIKSVNRIQRNYWIMTVASDFVFVFLPAETREYGVPEQTKTSRRPASHSLTGPATGARTRALYCESRQ